MTSMTPETPRRHPSAEKTAEKQRGKPFPKGQSGNPRGRPHGSRSLATQLLDAIGEESGEAIMKSVVRRARRGDMVAASLVLRRLWPEPRGRVIAIKLPTIATATDAAAAFAEIVAAVGRGDLTPEDGRVLGDLMTKFVQAVEIGEIEQRLAALERYESHLTLPVEGDDASNA
jgi:hypothetical protein